MDKGHEQTFFQRRYMNGQYVHEKILNITNCEGNANQTPMTYTLTNTKMTIIKKIRDTVVLVRM